MFNQVVAAAAEEGMGGWRRSTSVGVPRSQMKKSISIEVLYIDDESQL